MQLGEAKKYILKRLKDELPLHLSYHSVSHTKDVYSCCKTIAAAENVKGNDLKLLLTAALFHDTGFLKGYKEHEKKSCTIARQELPLFGYSKEQIKTVCGMIMATKIPQSAHTLLEEILCDADLDYLGRDDFFAIGNRLYHELTALKQIKTEWDWNIMQVKFLESHHYYTKTSQKLRLKKKDKNLSLVKSKLL